eukprot:GFYU01008013.1.p1 GENE.GFYU01008013.1~~GFYU01008013.1.p1  ORF type:complete len:190 (+),score=10.22 GFYU01008013.1:220-789(+)
MPGLLAPHLRHQSHSEEELRRQFRRRNYTGTTQPPHASDTGFVNTAYQFVPGSGDFSGIFRSADKSQFRVLATRFTYGLIGIFLVYYVGCVLHTVHGLAVEGLVYTAKTYIYDVQSDAGTLAHYSFHALGISILLAIAAYLRHGNVTIYFLYQNSNPDYYSAHGSHVGPASGHGRHYHPYDGEHAYETR